MAILQVKKIKKIKDTNGKFIEIKKTKEEYNKETKNGYATWYFYDRYKIDTKTKQYKSLKFTTKHEAMEEERLFLNNPIDYIKKHSKRAKIDDNIIVNNSKNINNLFDEFIEYYKKYVKESTIYCYRKKYDKHLKDLIGKNTTNDINFSFIKSIHEKIDKKDITTETKNTIHSTLVQFLEYLKKYELIEQNYAKSYGSYKKPKKDEHKTKEIRFQTLEEFNLFISIVDDDFWKLFFTFGFWHGNRKGEQRALMIKDIDLKNDLVNYNKTFTRDKNGKDILGSTKNDKEGKIYLASQCKNMLIKHIDFMKHLDGYNENWFLFGGPFYTSRTTIDRKLNEYYKKLKEKYPNKKITQLTYHEFSRHSHATYLYQVGKSNPNIVKIIAERLRDTEEVVREYYVHETEVASNNIAKELLKI